MLILSSQNKTFFKNGDIAGVEKNDDLINLLKMQKALDKLGLWAEFYDAGTVFFYEG